MWLLKLLFDQNLIIINYKSNDDLRVTSFLEGHKSDIRGTCSITPNITVHKTLTLYYYKIIDTIINIFFKNCYTYSNFQIH
jgi:hypothetical protein